MLDFEPTTKAIAYAISICPNISHSLRCDQWLGSPQIWSIGVENQFYIFFPLLVYFLSRKNLYRFLLLFIVGYTILPHAIDWINARTIKNAVLMDFNYKFYADSKFNSLAIGCLAGMMLSDKSKVLNLIYNKFLFYAATIAAIVIWALNINVFGYTDELMSVLFAIRLLNVCTNPNMDIRFENAATLFLGKISYGIYMYHLLIIELAFKLLPIQDTTLWDLAVHTIVLVVTILVAWLSFETYEKFFLNLKKRFER